MCLVQQPAQELFQKSDTFFWRLALDSCLFFGIPLDLKGTGGNSDQSKIIHLRHPIFHPFSDRAGCAVPKKWEADSKVPLLVNPK